MKKASKIGSGRATRHWRDVPAGKGARHNCSGRPYAQSTTGTTLGGEPQRETVLRFAKPANICVVVGMAQQLKSLWR
jgi:hypothetical protein